MLKGILISAVKSSGVKLMKPVFLNKLKAKKQSSNLLLISRGLMLTGSSTVWSQESGVGRVVAVGPWRLVCFAGDPLSYIAQIPPAWWQRPAAAEREWRPQTVIILPWHHIASAVISKIKHAQGNTLDLSIGNYQNRNNCSNRNNCFNWAVKS